MKPFNGFLFFLIIIFISTRAFAQDAGADSVAVNDIATVANDSQEVELTIDTLPQGNIPRKALMFSAVLPGLGQALNGKFWKIPIVYGGLVFLGWQIDRYNELYIKYKDEYTQFKKDPTGQSTTNASNRYETLIDRYRRERDYMIVWTGAFYLLQMVDAHVDAHLKDFELNPDLQVKIGPSLEPMFVNSMAGGIGVKLIIK